MEKIKYENVKALSFFFKKQIHCSQSSITTCLKPCLPKASKPWKSGIKSNARRRWSFFSRNKVIQIKARILGVHSSTELNKSYKESSDDDNDDKSHKESSDDDDKSHKESSDDDDGKSLSSSSRLSKNELPSSHMSQEERDDSSHTT